MVYERYLRDVQRFPLYVIGYYTALYLLTHFLIPFGIILFANVYVIRSMVILTRARRALTRQQEREQRTTLVRTLMAAEFISCMLQMLLTITLLFAFTNALPFILNVSPQSERVDEMISRSSFSWPSASNGTSSKRNRPHGWRIN